MTRTHGTLALPTLLLLGGALSLGCSPGRAQPGPTSSRTVPMMPGEQIFHTRCAICHDARGMGTIMLAKRLGADKSQLAKRTDLTTDYVTAIARSGMMSMPAFTRVDISDAELNQVAAYLTRNNPPETAK